MYKINQSSVSDTLRNKKKINHFFSSETVYEQTLSMTNWPIDTYVPTLKKQLKENGINISA